MATIVIGSNSYSSYASVAEADAYLAASINYATWTALTTDDKGRFLITASRFLDTITWQSTCLPLTTQANIVTATILIAEQLALGNFALIGGAPIDDDVKRYKAGSVELEYQSKPWFITRNQWANMPVAIFNLLRPCLQLTTGVGGASSFGTDADAGESNWLGDFGLNR